MSKAARSLVVGVVLAASLSACEKIDAEPFLGTWRYTSGSVTQTCNGDRSSSTPEGEAVVTVGTDSDLVFTYNNCAIGYELPLSGNGASASNQSCGGSSVRVNVETSSLGLNGDTLHQTETGTFEIFGTTCVYNTDAILTRVPAAAP
jgi:hypothetical protein